METQGTPLAGGTLFRLCVDFDELPIARWLLERRADEQAFAQLLLDRGASPTVRASLRKRLFDAEVGEFPDVTPLE